MNNDKKSYFKKSNVLCVFEKPMRPINLRSYLLAPGGKQITDSDCRPDRQDLPHRDTFARQALSSDPEHAIGTFLTIRRVFPHPVVEFFADCPEVFDEDGFFVGVDLEAVPAVVVAHLQKR